MRSPRNIYDSFLCLTTLMLVGAAFFLALSPHCRAADVVETWAIVFVQDPEREYPDLELECLNAVSIDAFIGDSGHRFHLCGTLTLRYDDANLVSGTPEADQIAPLHFSFVPTDGVGKEYDLERGVKFNIDATFYDWGYKYGNDIEGHFIPPMSGDTPPLLDDMLAEIWGKGKWCFGGASIGIYTVEEFEGYGITVPLYIKSPSGDDLFVYFQETGKDSIVIDLQTTSEVTKNIVIQEYTGELIIEAGPTEMPEFIINHIEGLQPGFEINIVDPKWSWFPNPCRQKTWYKEYVPWFVGHDNMTYIPYDISESATITHTTSISAAASNRLQDLTMKSYRLSDEPPELGSPDTLATVIRNLYGDIDRGYRRIKLDYYIQDATPAAEDIFIGSRILSSGSPELEAFNSGRADHIRIDFVYDNSNQNYIFTKGHRWNPMEPIPRYIVKMTSDVLDSPEPGNNWICLQDEPSIGGNNVDKILFETPLPDFGFDSLVVSAPPYLEFKDTGEPDSVFFTFRVKNSGSVYDGTSSVPIKCSMLFQKMMSDGTFGTMFNLSAYDAYLPSIAADGFWIDSFAVEIPTGYIGQQLDRAYFLFEVNIDPVDPNATVIEEQAYGFINNRMYTYMNLANYPDSAYASSELYADSETIVPDLPPINAAPPCDDIVYVYIADDTFANDGYMPSAIVQIGVGEYGTSPRDSNWQWSMCDYVKDMIDGDGNLWKVYEGSPCFFEFSKYRDYSYCFRAALDYFPSFSPAYIYVDSDGASCAADSIAEPCCEIKDNSYYYDKAGYAKVAPLGPMFWNRMNAKLFQDNFSGDTNVEGLIRADMAEDSNFPGNVATIPGDSIVIGCMVLDPSGMRVDGENRPEIYMHVKCTYNGPEPLKTSPLVGPQLQGDYGTFESHDGLWNIIQGDSAVDSSGDVSHNLFMFDLNDELFTRGYLIEYYFTAYDTNDEMGIFPYTAADGDYLEFTCLPTLASDILYVDDYDEVGSPDGLVHNFFDQTFKAVLPSTDQPDRYDVNDSPALLSNGLGSRAKFQHLIYAYNTIIWDSGDLTTGTICDSTSQSDKSRDCQILLEWLDLSDHPVNLFVLGDDIAKDLSERYYEENSILMNYFCNVRYLYDSYYELSGGCYLGNVMGDFNAVIQGVTGGPFDSDSYCLAGCYDFYSSDETPPWLPPDTTCPPLFKSYDVLYYEHTPYYAFEYPDIPGSLYYPYAGIYNELTNSLEQDVKTIWFGFSFKEIRDCELTAPIYRNMLLADVLTYFGYGGIINADLTGEEIPRIGMLAQNYPNPFNPSTVIRFTIREKGHVNLRIYNVAGQLVKTLVDEVREAGHHTMTWDGRNNIGVRVASGVYFCRLEAGSFNQTKKIVLLR